MLKPALFLKNATTVATLLAATAFPAAAQQALSPAQCRDAISISTQIMTRYRGKISADLAQSFGKFGDSKCDLQTAFTRKEGTADEQAFGEFRVKLIALRTPSG
jgi:hypothetical protein